MRDNDYPMVQRVEEFSPIHYEVLAFFDDHDILASPAVIGANIDYTKNYVGKTCRELAEAGVLDTTNGWYKLSERGRRLLSDDLDADEIRDINEIIAAA